MRYLIFFVAFFLSAAVFAQESDEVIIEEEYPQEESESLNEFSDQPQEESTGEYDYTEDDESDVEHSLLKPTDLRSTRAYQSEEIYHRTFDESKWRKIVGENDYKQNAPDPPDVPLPNFAWGGEILKAIGYTFIVAIVLIILYLVFKNIKLTSKTKYGGIAPFSSQDEEDIREMDLIAMLKQALTDNNFKLAVRLYYLSLLRNLDDAGVIKWEKDKTNRDYLFEIFSKEYHYEDIRKLTRSYEEVWYGDHHFPEDALRTLITQFESIHSRINPPKTL